MFFAEPTSAPCVMLGLASGLKADVSIFDIGLDCKTAADGLAVPRASSLACDMMENLLDGVYTVSDEEMFQLQAELRHNENRYIKVSCAAAMAGLAKVLQLHGAKMQRISSGPQEDH